MHRDMLIAPVPAKDAGKVRLVKGPNIVSLPEFEPLPDALDLEVLLKTGDDVSTDEILPAGSRILPFRSNVERLGDFAFEGVDPDYPARARKTGPHAVVGGRNYGQGSSREHAALVPRHLGLKLVVAVSYARIHWQNLVNFGVLPLTFADPDDFERLKVGDRLKLDGLRDRLERGRDIEAELATSGRSIGLAHTLSSRQIAMLRDGGIIPGLRT